MSFEYRPDRSQSALASIDSQAERFLKTAELQWKQDSNSPTQQILTRQVYTRLASEPENGTLLQAAALLEVYSGNVNTAFELMYGFTTSNSSAHNQAHETAAVADFEIDRVRVDFETLKVSGLLVSLLANDIRERSGAKLAHEFTQVWDLHPMRDGTEGMFDLTHATFAAETGAYEDAIEHYVRVPEELMRGEDITRYGVAHYSLGCCMATGNHFETATHLLEWSVAEDADQPDAWFYLGNAQLQQGELRLARNSFSHVVDLLDNHTNDGHFFWMVPHIQDLLETMPSTSD